MKVVKYVDGEVLPGIPTPRLVQLGGGYAYFVASEHQAAVRPDIGGVWYAVLPKEGYPAPEGARVERVIIQND